MRREPALPLTSRPTVSVFVPCYNYGHFLGGAVASVLEQPGVDLEVVIIDDASPDGSAAIGAAIAASDERVRFVAHRENQGHIATFNEGLGMLRGEYLVLLSADDMLTPGSLARAAALFEANPNVGLVYGHPLEFLDEPPPAPETVRDWTVWPGHEWLSLRFESGRNCIFCPEVVMRRSVFERVGGFNPALTHAGDLEMWLRLASMADVGRVNGCAQAYYRIHPQSMQRTVNAGHLRDLSERRDAFVSAMATAPLHAARKDELLAAARRALAVSALDRVIWAYDEGCSADEPIDAFLAFARDVWPAAEDLPQWRAVQRRLQRGPDRAQRGLLVAGQRVVRDLQDRVRWRRWRWSGV